MEPPVLDGIEYNKVFVSALREDCIALRNSALEVGEMSYAVSLSHVIAFMAYTIEGLER